MILDPAKIAGNAINNLVGTQIIIGLPSPLAPFPNVALGSITGERANTSAALPGLPTSQGDLNKIVAVNSSNMPLSFIISGNNPQMELWIGIVSTIYTLTAALSAQFLNYGSIIPNLSALTLDFVNAQINALKSMQDGGQPIILLNSFITLNAIAQKSPFLSSIWLLSDLSFSHEGAADSVFCEISVEEKLIKRNPYFSFGNLLTNFANEILGAGAGSVVSAVL